MDKTTELLSSYASDLTYQDLGTEVVHQVKRTLIDTLGCAMGGFHSEPARIARRLAANITGVNASRILGTNDRASSDMAGFANGVMVRYLDYNDSYFSPGGGHPSDMIPAALAGLSGTDGPALITATALAYEVFCRLSDEVVAGDLGWDQGIFSVIGAACAAGKTLGLDREQMGHAISLAVVPNLPLGATRVGELSMWKGCAAASATRAGIFAAQLAEQGMTGPSEPFDGRKGLWEQAVGTPATLDAFGGGPVPFRIADTIVKLFPSQIHTQGPIELALELRPQVPLLEIESVLVSTYRGNVSSKSTEPQKWDPSTRETADHSIPYVVAVALQDGAVTPDSFNSKRMHGPSLRPLMACVSIEEDPEFTRRFPAEIGCRMELKTRSGPRSVQGLVASTSFPKGHPRNPLNDSEIEDKFRGLATGVLTERQCDEALRLLWSLEGLSDLDELLDSLVVLGD